MYDVNNFLIDFTIEFIALWFIFTEIIYLIIIRKIDFSKGEGLLISKKESLVSSVFAIKMFSILASIMFIMFTIMFIMFTLFVISVIPYWKDYWKTALVVISVIALIVLYFVSNYYIAKPYYYKNYKKRRSKHV